VVVVTIDGCRWQEVFKGADSTLLLDSKFKKKFTYMAVKKFWANDEASRREKLMPFLWSVVSQKGILAGNRSYGNHVQVSNPYNISSPGYSEIFTGYADTTIKSNDLVYNPNSNAFEFINKQAGFQGKVASFASWDRANFFLNEPRSKYPVNAGYEPLDGTQLNAVELKLNEIQASYPLVISDSSRPDFLTWGFASEYIKQQHPRVVSLGFAYTDDMAHDGNYPSYLEQIHAFDAYIDAIWKQLQADPFYKNKTTLLVTVDHGRGLKEEWTSHGPKIAHSNEIWFALIGPKVKPAGELKKPAELYQNQFAQTLAGLLDLKFTAEHPVGNSISINDLK
jgi:hypothetical protein